MRGEEDMHRGTRGFSKSIVGSREGDGMCEKLNLLESHETVSLSWLSMRQP